MGESSARSCLLPEVRRLTSAPLVQDGTERGSRLTRRITMRYFLIHRGSKL